MTERFVVFDVETPNAANDRMSAIGVTVVENREIVQHLDTLINPDTQFDPFNIRLTGITPEAVREKPDFAQLWPILEPVFSRGVLVAHNATFDLAVLSRCLRAYHIEWKTQVPYLCTVRMSQRLFPQVPNHKLDTLSRYFGLQLDHHRAGSDADACAEILLRGLDACGSASPFLKLYNLNTMRTLQFSGVL